jgi:7,8-dihydro-6-hydroxymethylpterin-pyrophosphokinase
MQTSSFFSQPNLGGTNPQEFHNDLKYINLKNQFLKHLHDEIDLFERFINRTNTGGWSTRLNDGMKKKVAELKELYYALSTKNE